MINDQGKNPKFSVIAKDCTTGRCPTVLESGNPDDVVVVGRLDAAVLNSPDVQRHVAEGEIAVVIPRSLLVEAARALT